MTNKQHRTVCMTHIEVKIVVFQLQIEPTGFQLKWFKSYLTDRTQYVNFND